MLDGATPGGVTEPPLHEEIVNAMTHGFGFVLSLLGTATIVSAARSIDTRLAIACGVYASTLLVVYAVSTLSHVVQRSRPKHLLRAWDQGVIYFLIAGTYTPFACLLSSSYARWTVLAAIWGFALAGFLSKVVMQHRIVAFRAYSYVLLGWVPALTMMHRVSLTCLAWVLLGGVIYTVGTLFLALDRRFRFFHATWHLFVVAGSACHYYAILTFIVFQQVPA